MSADIQRQNLSCLYHQSCDLHHRLTDLLFSHGFTDAFYQRVSRISARAYKRLVRRFEAYKSFRMQEDPNSIFHQNSSIPFSQPDDIGVDTVHNSESKSDEPGTTQNNVVLTIKSNPSKHQDFQTYAIHTAYFHVLGQASLISNYLKEKDYSLAYSTLRALYTYLYHLELSHREDYERASIFFSQLSLYTKECLETSRKSNRSFRLSLNQYRSKLISLFDSSVSIEAA